MGILVSIVVLGYVLQELKVILCQLLRLTLADGLDHEDQLILREGLANIFQYLMVE